MLGIKLLDKIHTLWNQLQKLEDDLRNIKKDDLVKHAEKIMAIKVQIEQCFAVLDDYHKIDGLMNYSDADCYCYR